MGQCFPRDECQGGSAGTRGLPLQGDEPGPAEWTYLCKGPGVGSDQGRWPTGQAAVAPEPGSGRESGCLAGPRRPRDGPRPAGARGTPAVSGRQRCGPKDPRKGDQPLKNQDSPMHFTRGRWRTTHAATALGGKKNKHLTLSEMPCCTSSDKYGRGAQAGKTSNCLPGCCGGAYWFVPICLLSCPPTDLTIILMPICLIVGFSIPPLLSEILQEFQFGIRLSFQGIRFSGLPCFFFFHNAS